MTELVRPRADLFSSWRAAVDEFGDDTVHGSGFWHLTDDDRRALTAAGFGELVAELRSWSDPPAPLPTDRVPCDYLWIADGAEVVGFLALRHSLTEWLLNEGGHIGFSVRPSRRRQGHASRALGMAVRRAADLGLDRVLVTCDEENVGSARTIEANGGGYEDSRSGKRRYWIVTAA